MALTTDEYEAFDKLRTELERVGENLKGAVRAGFAEVKQDEFRDEFARRYFDREQAALKRGVVVKYLQHLLARNPTADEIDVGVSVYDEMTQA